MESSSGQGCHLSTRAVGGVEEGVERLAPQLCLSLLGTVTVGGKGQHKTLTEEKEGEKERSAYSNISK